MFHIFGLLCSLCNEFPRSARIRRKPKGVAARIGRDLRSMRFGKAVSVSEPFRSEPVTFCPDMIPFGVRWYQGTPLVELLLDIQANADLSGDLVSGFRRAKDLASQLNDDYRQDEQMIETMRSVMRTVSRDEVEVID